MTDVLRPKSLLELSAALEMSQHLCIDLVRGKPVSHKDVLVIRNAIRGTKAVLRALDESAPWESPSPSVSPSASVSGSSSASASASPSEGS